MKTSGDRSRVWFITCCSSGFGRALAAAVLARGYRCVVTARDPATVRDLAADVERADQVVLDHREEAVGRDVLRRRRELAAGVVDQDVDLAPRRDHLLDERLDLLGLADVARRGEHAIAGGQLGDGGVELVDGAAADRDPGAEPEQLARRRQPDPRAAAGDDRDLIGERAGREDLLGRGGRSGHRAQRTPVAL